MLFTQVRVAAFCHGSRAVLVALFFMSLFTSVWGRMVDEPTARSRAAAVIERLAASTSATQRLRRVVPSSLTLLVDRPSARLYADNAGRFALMSTDDRWPEVLAYGSLCHAEASSVSSLLAPWLQLYDRRLKAGLPTAVEAYDGPVVAPLLGAVRHQLAPYNNLCPYYIADDGSVSAERCVVGCVATALEEVISFHRPLVTLQDSLAGWTTAHYTIPTVYAGASVDTRLIRDNYDTPGTYTEAEAEAVARLSMWLGMAVKMNWGPASSGASLHRAEEPLRRAFGFPYVHYADSYKYATTDWLQMLRGEIQAGRPVCYAGSAMRLNGHAFVLDGLDADGLFHVNWGVDGDYDGYFRLDLLNAAEPAWDLTPTGAYEGFFCNQEAVLLSPYAVENVLPDTLSRTGFEIRIDSVAVGLPPEVGKITPLTLYLTNTSDLPLTTPFEVFTTLPTDTALFAQGDYAGFTGIRLEPHQSAALPFMARFDAGGDRTMHFSADDEHIVFSMPIAITTAVPASLTFAEPVLSFPAEGVVQILQTITNAPDAGRAGSLVTYEVIRADITGDHNGPAHADYCFLPAGESETDTIAFSGLVSGETYRLMVRHPWTVQREVTFTMPGSSSAVTTPTTDQTVSRQWHDLQGRPTQAPLSAPTTARKVWDARSRTVKVR